MGPSLFFWHPQHAPSRKRLIFLAIILYILGVVCRIVYSRRHYTIRSVSDEFTAKPVPRLYPPPVGVKRRPHRPHDEADLEQSLFKQFWPNGPPSPPPPEEVEGKEEAVPPPLPPIPESALQFPEGDATDYSKAPKRGRVVGGEVKVKGLGGLNKNRESAAKGKERAIADPRRPENEEDEEEDEGVGGVRNDHIGDTGRGSGRVDVSKYRDEKLAQKVQPKGHAEAEEEEDDEEEEEEYTVDDAKGRQRPGQDGTAGRRARDREVDETPQRAISGRVPEANQKDEGIWQRKTAKAAPGVVNSSRQRVEADDEMEEDDDNIAAPKVQLGSDQRRKLEQEEEVEDEGDADDEAVEQPKPAKMHHSIPRRENVGLRQRPFARQPPSQLNNGTRRSERHKPRALVGRANDRNVNDGSRRQRVAIKPPPYT
ncbi:hypothetical protein HK104_010356 [Borealophlyctis nickersoniae]|nr:hypothetical protein HK104_010356 [Borealophlyctis nickersoniae]